VNARIDENGKVVTQGSQIEIGGNDKYESMCWGCWQEAIKGDAK
jgi:thymidine kinase